MVDTDKPLAEASPMLKSIFLVEDDRNVREMIIQAGREEMPSNSSSFPIVFGQ